MCLFPSQTARRGFGHRRPKRLLLTRAGEVRAADCSADCIGLREMRNASYGSS